MADLTILTTNQAGDGWIDTIPGQVSTGYQAQNTNITARSLGQDLTTVTVDDDEIVVSAFSGNIDVDGVPFVMNQEKTFAKGSISFGVSYIYLQAGVNDFEKNLALTTLKPTWDAVKHGYYTSSGERVLSYVITRDAGTGEGTLTVRPLETGIVRNNIKSQGIGLGGERTYTTGVHSLTIARDGLYELFALGGGSSATINNIGVASGGKGGSSARVLVYLELGDVITLEVGGADSASTIITSSGAISITAPNDSSPVISGTTVPYEQYTYQGADPLILTDDETGDDIAIFGGGGAGRYSNGYTSGGIGLIIGKIEDRGNAGFVGSSGTTGNATGGLVQVKWISD